MICQEYLSNDKHDSYNHFVDVCNLIEIWWIFKQKKTSDFASSLMPFWNWYANSKFFIIKWFLFYFFLWILIERAQRLFLFGCLLPMFIFIGFKMKIVNNFFLFLLLKLRQTCTLKSRPIELEKFASVERKQWTKLSIFFPNEISVKTWNRSQPALAWKCKFNVGNLVMTSANNNNNKSKHARQHMIFAFVSKQVLIYRIIWCGIASIILFFVVHSPSHLKSHTMNFIIIKSVAYAELGIPTVTQNSKNMSLEFAGNKCFCRKQKINKILTSEWN